MRWSSWGFGTLWRGLLLCALGLAFIGLFVHAQPEGKRITFYAAQTSYSLPVADRNNAEYIGLFEALEPLGPVSAKVDGNKWKLKFRDTEAQFEKGKTKAKVRGKSFDFPAAFVLENGRGFVPIQSLKDLLPLLVGTPADVHQTARRAFIGVPAVRVTAKQAGPGKLSFTFSAPVNPFIATEPGKLRMSFSREPLESEWQTQTFEDRLFSGATYTEANGAAELTVNSPAPLIATFSDDRKMITVAAVAPQSPSAPVKTQSQAAAPTASQPPAPVAHPRPSIIIDAAHGGTDPGATLSEKIVEKDVTLALARQLKRELENRGIPCIMLRDADQSIPIADRTASANSSKAILYVAIHASTVGIGVRTFVAPVAPEAAKPLQFLRVNAAQAPYVQVSRAVASFISTELLKRDMPGVSAPGAVSPLSDVHLPAIAVEVAPPPRGSAADLVSTAYQRSVASGVATALAIAQNREAAR